MTDIRPTGMGAGTYGGANVADPAATQKLLDSAGLAHVDSAKLLGEMAKLAATLNTQSPGGTPGVTNANGAPSIDGVRIEFSAEDMAAALLVLQGKTQDAQLATAKEGLTTSKKKLEEKNQQAMDKIKDWIEKCKEAAAKEKAGGIFGWITKIAGFIAAAFAVAVAAVATVATGGAAAPLLALAIVGLVGASISLASQISQAAGGPALELSTLMSKLCTKIMIACGVPEDKAEAAGKIMSGMAGLLSGAVLVDPAFGGQLFGGIAELAGGDAMQVAIVTGVFSAVTAIATSVLMIVATGGMGAGAAIDGVAKSMIAIGRVGQAVASVTSGAAAAAQGGIGIAKAFDERDAANIQADKKTIDAVIAKLQKQMEEDREQLKKVLDEIMEGVNLVSQMINSAAQSRSQISANMGGKAATI